MEKLPHPFFIGLACCLIIGVIGLYVWASTTNVCPECGLVIPTIDGIKNVTNIPLTQNFTYPNITIG